MKYLPAHLYVEDVSWTSGVILPVDKPMGWTSFDVVNKLRFLLRKITGVKRIKVGHAGTLDPMATGLLLIAVGKATKTIEQIVVQEKAYEGTMILGATTPSYDAETEVDGRFPTEHITDEMIASITRSFHGKIEQYPPIYSAIKKDGKPLYKYARAGQEVEIEPREVTIASLEMSRLRQDELSFLCRCSKGTYIRSLVHDVGRGLQSGAYMTSLRRTAIGSYNISAAWGMDLLCTVLQDQIDKSRS